MAKEVATAADYVNRTVDVAAVDRWLDVNERSRRVLGTLASADLPGGMVVTGVAKLAQRYLLSLFTDRGSLVYLPTSGTDFLSDARKGLWRTVADVHQSFASARLDVARQLVRVQQTTDSADEQYASSELLGVDFQGDQVVLQIQILSQAGSSVKIVAPLPTAL